MKNMKTFILSVLLVAGTVTNIFSQKLEFSAHLAPGGGVHSSAPSVSDRNGNIFVAGGTRDGLRVTNDALQKSYSGHADETGGDIFLMKLSPDGELLYSSYIGGSGSENYCLQIAIDDSDNVYVGFTTDSKDLPVSDNACQKSTKGDNDHYIIKFTNDCKYIASTFIGGSGSDHWTRLAVNDNKLYLFGKSMSPDFPVTGNAFQNAYDNSAPPDTGQSWMAGDITITVLTLNLDKILCSSYLGGNSLDYVTSFSFGFDDKIILVGGTYSGNFPVTEDAYKKYFSGKKDGFLTIVNKNLSKIFYSTYIGGDSTDQVNSVIVSDAGNLILAGETKSPDFPVTPDALYGSYLGGRSDGFIMKFDLTTNKPAYSTFLGGSKSDFMNYSALTGDQKFVLVGTSGSKDFPVSKDALFPSITGGLDLVILILDKDMKKIEFSTFGGGTKQIMMIPNAVYYKSGKLIISVTCVSPDFPVSIKYAESDSTWTNCMMKFDLNAKYSDAQE